MKTNPNASDDGTGTRTYLIQHARASAESGVLNPETSWRLEDRLQSIPDEQLHSEFFLAYAGDFADLVFHRALANQPEWKKTEIIYTIRMIGRSADSTVKTMALRWTELLILIDQIPGQLIQNGCQLLRQIDLDKQMAFIEDALSLIVEKFGANSGQVTDAKAYFTKLAESSD